jgi:hypothetical protein
MTDVGSAWSWISGTCCSGTFSISGILLPADVRPADLAHYQRRRPDPAVSRDLGIGAKSLAVVGSPGRCSGSMQAGALLPDGGAMILYPLVRWVSASAG